MTFEEAVLECASNKELVNNFNRLTGRHFLESPQRAPIEMMIDRATGYVPGLKHDDCYAFFEFVRKYIWERVNV